MLMIILDAESCLEHREKAEGKFLTLCVLALFAYASANGVVGS